MKIEEFDAALRVIGRLEQAGFEAVIVGGAVRDFLLNRKVNDVDVATNALPFEVKAVFSSTVDIGIEHGTVLVLDEGQPIEVTTYRTEGTYADHRRPDQVLFVRSLEEDLQRRDFTINAMALTKEGKLIDYYGGKKDIESQIIRAVGDANNRFREDALRMLRAIRFSAQLGFTIEKNTLEAIQKDSDLIEFIAKERIHMELSKMWKGPYVYNGIKSLVKSELSNYLKGNFEGNLEQWRQFTTVQSEIGWAYVCLLNRSEMQEIINYYKLSNKEKSFIKNVLKAYDALARRWTELDYFENELSVLEAAYDFTVWQHHSVPFGKEQIALIKTTLPIQSMDQLAINGHHLMIWSSNKRGPWIKEAMEAALIAVLSGQVKNDIENLKEWFINEFNNKG